MNVSSLNSPYALFNYVTSPCICVTVKTNTSRQTTTLSFSFRCNYEFDSDPTVSSRVFSHGDLAQVPIAPRTHPALGQSLQCRHPGVDRGCVHRASLAVRPVGVPPTNYGRCWVLDCDGHPGHRGGNGRGADVYRIDFGYLSCAGPEGRVRSWAEMYAT